MKEELTWKEVWRIWLIGYKKAGYRIAEDGSGFISVPIRRGKKNE